MSTSRSGHWVRLPGTDSSVFGSVQVGEESPVASLGSSIFGSARRLRQNERCLPGNEAPGLESLHEPRLAALLRDVVNE